LRVALRGEKSTPDTLSWSPTGEQFAFLNQRSEGETSQQPLLLGIGSTADWACHFIELPVLPRSSAIRDDRYAFAWSPDGQWLAYSTVNGDIQLVLAGKQARSERPIARP
jgi:Tol biopolymer transport system component